MVRNLGITLPEDLVDEIDDRRESTTSRSEWIREACQARLDEEDREDDANNQYEAPADD